MAVWNIRSPSARRGTARSTVLKPACYRSIVHRPRANR
jgi:hypothetical protein